MEKHLKNNFWNFALFTRFNLSIVDPVDLGLFSLLHGDHGFASFQSIRTVIAEDIKSCSPLGGVPQIATKRLVISPERW